MVHIIVRKIDLGKELDNTLIRMHRVYGAAATQEASGDIWKTLIDKAVGGM